MHEATPNEGRSGPDHARVLAASGPVLAWGLALAGASWGASHAIDRLAEAPATTAGFASAILRGLAIATGLGLSGWAGSVACRLAGAAIAARADRRARSDEALAALAGRAIAAFERLADVLERRPAAATAPAPPELERAIDAHDRSRRLVEIDQALRSGRRDDAGALIDELSLRFPEDPVLAELRERLDAARRQEFEGNLAQIRAARQVNDHARVLELYRSLEPSPDFDRGVLERELSRWFLELIHRRLRVGRIQADVVELAATVAETFAATVEGASLRASLPTLRRSVGLCPRCGRPYPGTADACPQCLVGNAGTRGAEPAETEPGPVDDPDIGDNPGSPEPSADGRGSGWMFYDEDDRDDPSPPA